MGSSVRPKISIGWNFDMILCGKDIVLPEGVILDPFIDCAAYHEEWESWIIRKPAHQSKLEE